jgi:hypothetical protein
MCEVTGSSGHSTLIEVLQVGCSLPHLAHEEVGTRRFNNCSNIVESAHSGARFGPQIHTALLSILLSAHLHSSPVLAEVCVPWISWIRLEPLGDLHIEKQDWKCM